MDCAVLTLFIAIYAVVTVGFIFILKKKTKQD